MKQKQRSMSTLTMRLTGLLFLAMVVFISGCKEDDPEPVNEEELITTVNLVFTKLNDAGQPDGSSPLVFSWYDEDGSGSMAPVIDDISLDASTAYSLDLELLDESKTPAGNITEEIAEEDDEHQFFFQSTGINIPVTYNDADANGKPIGLATKLTTPADGQGIFKIILRHMPNKAASGVSAGDITNAGGETDIETSFNVSVGD